MCGQLTIGPRLAALESANNVTSETIESVNEVDMSHMTARVGPNPMTHEPFCFLISIQLSFTCPAEEAIQHTVRVQVICSIL